MNGAIQISWKAGIPGRESKGLEVFGSAVARFEALAKEGRIHTHQEYFAVTGKDGGFMLVTGELPELLKLAAEPETLALNAQAASIVQDFDIQIFGGGTDQSVQELMGTYMGSLQQLGYM
ncbi:MAG: hypothetical protein JWM02_2959 [Frankiales bacterium]|nr:hypothetical protein [Frankiales bacterium]